MEELKLSRLTKEKMMEAYASRLKKYPGVILSGYKALSSGEMNELRQNLEKINVSLLVVRNRLMRSTLHKAELEGLQGFVTGQTAIAFTGDDPVAVSKVLADFAKAHQGFEIRAGVIDKMIYDAKRIRELAALPGREVLIATVVRTIKSPISSFVYVLRGTLDKTVRVIEGIRKKKEGGK